MREIKFRLFDIKAKKMRTVDDLKNLWTLNDHEGDLKTIPHVIAINQSYRGDDLELVVDKDCYLMQFTGIFDENKKEVYEGDLLKDEKGNVGEVFYIPAQFQIRWKHVDGTYDTDDCFGYGNVIGNIHENPELFKED